MTPEQMEDYHVIQQERMEISKGVIHQLEALPVGGDFSLDGTEDQDNRPLYRTEYDENTGKFIPMVRRAGHPSELKDGYKELTWGGTGGTDSEYLKKVTMINDDIAMRRRKGFWQEKVDGEWVPYTEKDYIARHMTPLSTEERTARNFATAAAMRPNREDLEMTLEEFRSKSLPPPITITGKDGQLYTVTPVSGETPAPQPTIEEQAAGFREAEEAAPTPDTDLEPLVPGRGAGIMERQIASGGAVKKEMQAVGLTDKVITELESIDKGATELMEVYAAFTRAETGGSKDKFIRTQYRDAPGGSSAYGPAQITMGLALEHRNNNAKNFTKEELAYLDRFIEQGKNFLTYGNVDNLPKNKQKYDYGGKGDLGTKVADKEMYARVATKMLGHIWGTIPSDTPYNERLEKMADIWHYGKRGVAEGKSNRRDDPNYLKRLGVDV
jgi:hypothetical protein